MQSVRAGLGDGADHASAGTPVLGAERIGDHAEFLQRVDPDQETGGAAGRVVTGVVDITAIHQKADLAGTVAFDHELGSGTARIGRTHRRRDARLQQRELRKIAPVQGKLADRNALHDVGERRIARVHEFR